MTDTTDIAVPAGVDKEGRRLFRKGDSLLTEDELQADAEKLYASQAEDLELNQELGLVNRRVRSMTRRRLTSCERSKPSMTMLIRSMESRPISQASPARARDPKRAGQWRRLHGRRVHARCREGGGMNAKPPTGTSGQPIGPIQPILPIT